MNTNTAPINTAKPAAEAVFKEIPHFFCSLCVQTYEVPPGWPPATCTRCGHKVCRQCISYTRGTNAVLGLEPGEPTLKDNFGFYEWPEVD